MRVAKISPIKNIAFAAGKMKYIVTSRKNKTAVATDRKIAKTIDVCENIQCGWGVLLLIAAFVVGSYGFMDTVVSTNASRHQVRASDATLSRAPDRELWCTTLFVTLPARCRPHCTSILFAGQ
jgi:hypothetical protein